MAASRNLLVICKLLIMFGCDINHKDIAGRTALFFAVKNNFQEIAITLVANFGSCFLVDKYNSSLTQIASEPMMRLIIEKGKIYQILNRLKYRATDTDAKRESTRIIRETIE